MKGLFRVLFAMGFCLYLTGCSTTRHVKEGDYLLDKVEIVSDNEDFKSANLSSYLAQQPNFKVFGLLKWPLHVYNWAGKDDKWVNRLLRRFGEAPVLLDTVLVDQSEEELRRYFVNKGYVHARVDASIDTSKSKKAVVKYEVITHEPYRIRNYSMDISDTTINRIAHMQQPRRPRFASPFRAVPEDFTPLVKEGSLFDRDVLDAERQRLTSLLRRRGYFAFNRDYISYKADSAFNKQVVDLSLQVNPILQKTASGEVISMPHSRYYINDVFVETDYDPINQDASVASGPKDTVKIGNMAVLYGADGRVIRPSVLRKNIYITPGMLYNERTVEQTYASFSALRALKNVNIRFSEFLENDTMKLNCTILTTPAKPQSVGVDLEGTNSAGDFGFATSLNYQHRNLFKGAEVFSAKVRGAYESLSGGFAQDYFEYGGEASITFPEFLFPFVGYDMRRKLRASSELKVSYNYQTRPEYSRTLLSGGWSYIWQERANSQGRHVFKLLDVDYMYLPRINQAFKDSLPESTRLYNYSDQFIMGSGYTYSFTNYNPLFKQRNTHSLRASVELAGNMLYGLSKLTKASKDENGIYNLFGINYAQFVKADFDFSKSIVLDERNSIAYRIGAGVGFPYGNAEMLPFERRYFSGGANSVRGWSVRRLGPGSMAVTDSTSFFNQSGDVRLDLSVEYRSKLFWKFEMAAFVDAGNIWTIRPYSFQDKGNFDFSRFYKEIALSYGLGLRVDFDFFLIRFDTGFKAYNPQETGKERWAILKPNFTNNFAWHFAVGYPF